MAALRGLLAAFASAAASQALELHVSDRAAAAASARAGTRERPFATLHEARDAMRAGVGADEPRTVRVEGDHHLSEPLLLDERDSGTATAPVTWTSLDPAKPARVTGGVKLPVSAFSPATVPSGASGVMKISLFDHGLNSSAIRGMANPYPFCGERPRASPHP